MVTIPTDSYGQPAYAEHIKYIIYLLHYIIYYIN
jgi:hypothetical protein